MVQDLKTRFLGNLKSQLRMKLGSPFLNQQDLRNGTMQSARLMNK